MKPAVPAYRSRRFAKRTAKASPVRRTAPVAKAISAPPPAPEDPPIDPELLRAAIQTVIQQVAQAYAQAGHDAAVRTSSQQWAQAGADAAVQALTDRGMLGKPVVLKRTVKTVVRDGPTPPGGIVGSVEDHEYGPLEDPKQ